MLSKSTITIFVLILFIGIESLSNLYLLAAYNSLASKISLISKQEPEILLSDDFEYSPISWSTFGEDGYSVNLTTYDYPNRHRRFTGQSALYLRPHIDPNDTAEAVKFFGISQSLKVKISLVFCLPNENGASFAVGLVRYHEGTGNRAFIRYDIENRKWQYEDSYLHFTDVPNGAQVLWANYVVWHRLILEVDFDTNKYISLEVDEKVIDMSAVSIWLDDRWPEIWNPGALASIYTGTTGGLCIFYVDSVQVTEI